MLATFFLDCVSVYVIIMLFENLQVTLRVNAFDFYFVPYILSHFHNIGQINYQQSQPIYIHRVMKMHKLILIGKALWQRCNTAIRHRSCDLHQNQAYHPQKFKFNHEHNYKPRCCTL